MSTTVSRAGGGAAAPTEDDVVQAARTVRGHARVTPLFESGMLSRETGGRVFLKAECLQRTGSFKFRGAYNRIAAIPREELAQGVVGWSSGNHAQGVAGAAALFGAAATIVMPSDATPAKIDGVRRLGGDIVFYDRHREGREAAGEQVLAERGGHFVHPFDDPLVVSGQGTVGLEIAAQTLERDRVPDVALVPCGGGGLIAGIATVLRARFPDIDIRSVEPASHDDMRVSLERGERMELGEGVSTVCDSLIPPRVGDIAFAVGRTHLGPGLAVTDAEVLHAVGYALRHLKLVVEPGGAAALAALLAGKINVEGKTVVVVLSGGNASPDVLARALRGSTDTDASRS